jgi:hypothetical protein
MTNKIKKIKNKIFAIPAAAPAIPAKPNTAAIIAMTKKMTTQVSMIMLLYKKIVYLQK